MSLLRACQFCGHRMRGIVPGAMTILMDGQPLDASVVLCAEHGMEVRRVLDMLRQRSTVAQHARSVDVTQPLTPVVTAPTEMFPKIAIDERGYRRESLGEWRPDGPLDDGRGMIPVPVPPRPRRNLGGLRALGRRPY